MEISERPIVLQIYIVFLVLCRITCTISDDSVTDDRSCSSDGEDCSGESSMYSTSSSLAELPAETNELLHTITAIELYRAQREVAHYLELAYLHLADHPEQAKEVRLTAHSARTQHLMTTGLMKKFSVTAAHIVKTLIPMIIDAVVELRSPEVVREIFGQIIKIAEEMKNETEQTHIRYLDIQTEVQKNMASVTSRNKKVVSEQERLKVEMERERQLAKAAELAVEELDIEKKAYEEQLKILTADKENFRKQAEKTGTSTKKTVFNVLTPGAALNGGISFILTGVNMFSGLFGSNKSQKNLEKLLDAYLDTQKATERVMGAKLDVIGRMHAQRKEALERLATIKKLGVQTANLGNVESLREAHAELGNVDKQLTRINLFWSSMSAAVKALRDESTSGSVYLAQIENPKFTKRFQESIRRSEKGWIIFRQICSDYVQESDTAIFSLYNFLSAPIDKTSAEARAQRVQDVLHEIEADIEYSLPKQDKETE